MSDSTVEKKTSDEEVVSYWSYVKVDELLELQKPLTDAHDELQFIMIHQIFELWFKLAIYELRSAIKRLSEGDINGGASLLKRVAVIFRTSHGGFDPLMTMSQQGYLEFRDALAPASGFQSAQFRIIEMLLGIERVPSPEGSEKRECFYWEGAVQAGATIEHFVDKYYESLTKDYEELGENNLRRLMLRITEEATGKSGAEAYRHLLANREEWPTLHALAETARDLQAALLDFRLSHHKVTVFTIGEHTAGTSDAHAGQHSSCAHYLLGVIKDQSTIFPELEVAMAG